ncbi:hypothetical protein GCM10027515_09260 [Schumannella luteola]
MTPASSASDLGRSEAPPAAVPADPPSARAVPSTPSFDESETSTRVIPRVPGAEPGADAAATPPAPSSSADPLTAPDAAAPTRAPAAGAASSPEPPASGSTSGDPTGDAGRIASDAADRASTPASPEAAPPPAPGTAERLAASAAPTSGSAPTPADAGDRSRPDSSAASGRPVGPVLPPENVETRVISLPPTAPVSQPEPTPSAERPGSFPTSPGQSTATSSPADPVGDVSATDRGADEGVAPAAPETPGSRLRAASESATAADSTSGPHGSGASAVTPSEPVSSASPPGETSAPAARPDGTPRSADSATAPAAGTAPTLSPRSDAAPSSSTPATNTTGVDPESDIVRARPGTDSRVALDSALPPSGAATETGAADATLGADPTRSADAAPPPLREPEPSDNGIRSWFLPSDRTTAGSPSAPIGASSPVAPVADTAPPVRPVSAVPPTARPASEPPVSPDVFSASGEPTEAPSTAPGIAFTARRPEGVDRSEPEAPAVGEPTDAVEVLFGELDIDPVTGSVTIPDTEDAPGASGDEDDRGGEPSAAPARAGVGGLLRRLTGRDAANRTDEDPEPDVHQGDLAETDASDAAAGLGDEAAPATRVLDLDDVADFDPAPELGREPDPSVTAQFEALDSSEADDDSTGIDDALGPVHTTVIPVAPEALAPTSAPEAIAGNAVPTAPAVAAPRSAEPTSAAIDRDRPRTADRTSLPVVAADGTPRFTLAPSGEPDPGRSTLLERIAFGAAFVVAPIGLVANIVLGVLSTRRRGWTHRLTSAGVAVGVVMTIVGGGLLAFGNGLAQDAIDQRATRAESGAMCHLIATEPVGAEQTDFGWPAAQSSIPDSVAAAQAFVDRWDAVAAVAPSGIRAEVTQIAGLGRELLAQIQESQTADDAGAQQRLSALRDQSGVPTWIADNCS